VSFGSTKLKFLIDFSSKFFKYPFNRVYVIYSSQLRVLNKKVWLPISPIEEKISLCDIMDREASCIVSFFSIIEGTIIAFWVNSIEKYFYFRLSDSNGASN